MINSVLTYISHKWRIDADYFYRGFSWLAFATACVMLISLFKSYVFANHLSPETFGTYRYLMTFIEVATAFTLTGIPLVVSRSVAQGFGGTYVRGVVAYLKHSYIALTLTTAAALYYAYFENYTFALVLALAGVLSIGVNAARLYNAVLEGKKRSDLNARYQIISNTIPALLVIACVLLDYSLVAIILVFFSSQLVLHGFFALRVRKIFNLGNEDDPTAKKFSFHLSVMGALSLATEHIDKLFLFQWLGPAQLALYTFSTALPEQFNVLGKSLRTLVYPKISERPFAVTKKHIFKKTLYLFFVCTVLFISYISIAPFLFTWFFPQYIGAVLFSQVYALSIFFLLAVPYKSVLFAYSRTRTLYHTKIALILSRLILLAVLLPLLGVWGAIISYLCARALEMGMYMYAVHFGTPDALTVEQNQQLKKVVPEVVEF